MTTWWWPTQVADLGEGGGAELLDLADGEGVGFEVAGFDAGVHLDLRLLVAAGWPVRMPRALTLRTPEGEVSPSRNSWWAMRTDLVVEGFEGEGVAGGFEAGGAEEVGGLGVGEGDVPAGLGVVLAVFVVLGVVRGDGVGDEPVDDHGAAGTAVGELFVDPDRCGLGQAVGLAGDAAGLPGRHLQPTNAFPEHGEPVAEVEGVGDQLRPGRGGHAQRQRERFGVNAATAGVPRRRVTRRPGGPHHRTSRPRCRRWRGGGRPSGRRAGACGTRPSFGSRSVSAAASSTPRGRGRRPRTPRGPSCSWD